MAIMVDGGAKVWTRVWELQVYTLWGSSQLRVNAWMRLNSSAFKFLFYIWVCFASSSWCDCYCEESSIKPLKALRSSILRFAVCQVGLA
jgi:hypothetical protein